MWLFLFWSLRTHRGTVELEIELRSLSEARKALRVVSLTCSWGFLVINGETDRQVCRNYLHGIERICVSFCSKAEAPSIESSPFAVIK